MEKINYTPPLWNIPPPHADPEKVKQLRKALGGPHVLHDEVITQCDYEEFERRLLESMDDFFKPEE